MGERSVCATLAYLALSFESPTYCLLRVHDALFLIGQPRLLCSATQEINKMPSVVAVSISDGSLKHFRQYVSFYVSVPIIMLNMSLNSNPYTSTQTRELSGTLEIEDKRIAN